MRIIKEFQNVSALRDWLEENNFNSGSSEAFHEWLSNFFDKGNIIVVRDEEYDYWDCVELI